MPESNVLHKLGSPLIDDLPLFANEMDLNSLGPMVTLSSHLVICLQVIWAKTVCYMGQSSSASHSFIHQHITVTSVSIKTRPPHSSQHRFLFYIFVLKHPHQRHLIYIVVARLKHPLILSSNSLYLITWTSPLSIKLCNLSKTLLESSSFPFF